MDDMSIRIENAAKFIRKQLQGLRPTLAVVLGSGFSGWTDQFTDAVIVPYAEIPSFPKTTVEGHKGRLLIANLQGQSVLIMQGRFHYYEGHPMALIGIPIRVFSLLGVKTLLLTNAAGGINPTYRPSDVMVIDDHINFVQNNPLIGPNLDTFGPRFPDATTIYTDRLAARAQKLANDHGLTAHRGIYAFVSGPCFETPAEIRMMARLGADVVGMSTVPESITARHAGMHVVGISMVANLAAGRNSKALTHQEVMATMSQIAPKVNRYLTDLVLYLTKNNP